MTMECVEKLIKKDMLCPISGKKLKDSDIIPLNRVSSMLITSVRFKCIEGAMTPVGISGCDF